MSFPENFELASVVYTGISFDGELYWVSRNIRWDKIHVSAYDQARLPATLLRWQGINFNRELCNQLADDFNLAGW